MDEKKVLDAFLGGSNTCQGVVEAIRAAVEPLEERIDSIDNTLGLRGTVEDIKRVYGDRLDLHREDLDALEKRSTALEDSIALLEDCESAIPEEQQYKHTEYGAIRCKCGWSHLGELPEACPQCGKSLSMEVLRKISTEGPPLQGDLCCTWLYQRIADGRIMATEIECSAPYETQLGLLLRYCPSCGTKL
jgi:hypothetical protein